MSKMIKLTIDGKEIEIEEGKTILEAARKDAKYLLNNLDNEEFREYLDYIESKYKENVETIA